MLHGWSFDNMAGQKRQHPSNRERYGEEKKRLGDPRELPGELFDGPPV